MAFTTSYAYLVRPSANLISQYTINADGTLTLKCTLNTGLSQPWGIAIHGAFAYVTCYGNSTLWQFNLAGATT